MHHFAAFGQDFQNLRKLFIFDLDHVEQQGEEGWSDVLAIEHNIIVDSIHGGATLDPQFFQGGHEVGLMLHGGQVHGLPNLIVV